MLKLQHHILILEKHNNLITVQHHILIIGQHQNLKQG